LLTQPHEQDMVIPKRDAFCVEEVIETFGPHSSPREGQ
jgi:hypothetical protein